MLKTRDLCPAAKLNRDVLRFMRRVANVHNSRFPEGGCRHCGAASNREHSTTCEYKEAKALMDRRKELYAPA